MPRDADKHSDRDQLLDRVAELTRRIKDLECDIERMHRLATLGTIAGSIAHEFNNILTPVMSYAQLALHARQDTGLVEKALQKTIEGTDRAAQIASAMLGFVRDGPSDSFADVKRVVADSLACIGRDPAKDGVELQIDVQTGIIAKIQAVALQQVLLNLILNAMDAMHPGSGRIWIRAARSTGNVTRGFREASEQGSIIIAVQDNGCGISAKSLPKIFEPFVTSRQHRNNGEGTGLGLAICRRLITQAGGTIIADSVEGEGTTFTITLPEAETPVVQQAA